MKTVILDRDGVINYESRAYIKNKDEWQPLPGSLEAIARLTNAGYKIFITTNQSGVGRGYFTEEILHDIHNTMLAKLAEKGGAIEKIYYCPHHPEDKCTCRKPLTGMFDKLSQEYNVNLQAINATYIGDSLRDVEVGLAAGCKFYLIAGLGGDGHETLTKLTPQQKQQIEVFTSLAEAVDNILCKN